MRAENTHLLQELNEAVLDALGSYWNADAGFGSGYRVFVSVDLMLDDAEILPEGVSGMSFPSNAFSLSPSDELFLRMLHIAV